MTRVKKDTKPAVFSNGISIGLFIIAIIMLAVTVYMFIYSYNYIASYASTYGVSVSDMGQEAIQYIISGAAPYFSYAVIIFASSVIIGKLNACKQSEQDLEVSDEEELEAIDYDAEPETAETETEDQVL